MPIKIHQGAARKNSDTYKRSPGVNANKGSPAEGKSKDYLFEPTKNTIRKSNCQVHNILHRFASFLEMKNHFCFNMIVTGAFFVC